MQEPKKTVHFPNPTVSKRFANLFSLPDKPLFHNPAINSNNIILSTTARRTLQSNYTVGFSHAISVILTTKASTTAHTNSCLQSCQGSHQRPRLQTDLARLWCHQTWTISSRASFLQCHRHRHHLLHQKTSSPHWSHCHLSLHFMYIPA